MTSFKTYSGLDFDFSDIKESSICLEDIAHHLSKVERFGGSLSSHHFYSVAQHSVIVAAIALIKCDNVDFAKFCLLHDASEAYLGDVITPLKTFLKDYQKIESNLSEIINYKYRVGFSPYTPIDYPGVCSEIDKDVFKAEYCHFFGGESEFELPDGLQFYNEKQMFPGWSKKLFLYWCYKLSIDD